MSSVLMNIGARAMAAQYAALLTAGHNIANANTPGYSRQSVSLETSPGQFTGAGFFGRGVNIAAVTRTHDQFLTREALGARALAAGDAARAQQLSQLEKIFPTGEAGLGYATGQLINAFVDVANRPGDLSARQVVLGRAEELAGRFRAAGAQIDELQAGVVQDLRHAIGTVNQLAQAVAAVNQQIATAGGTGGHPPNDLLDERDRLIAQISEHLQVTTLPADDGTVSLFIGGGQRLVLGNEATTLVAVSDPFDPSRAALGLRDAAGDRVLPAELIGGGGIAGLLRFQNEDLVDARNLIGQMAAAVGGALNEQQALGLDLTGTAGSPLFSVGDPLVRPATTNARNPDGSYTASVSLGVVSPGEVQASDYLLQPDPAGAPGSYLLTRLSDGLARTITSPAVLDGLRIEVDPARPLGAKDRVLLQPVAAAARDMRRELTDPAGLAAAAPYTATAGTTNRGTAAVGLLQATSTAPNPVLGANQALDITFTSATGYDIELVDASTTPPTRSTIGSGTWVPGQPIRLADSPPLQGWSLQLTGVPRGPETVGGVAYPGDTIRIENTAYPAKNNGNARAFVALGEAAIVGRQRLPDGSVTGGANATDAYANAMADIGVRVQGANSTAEISATVAGAAESARANQAGVNLDEEAARLMQFQQAYQAAAKMLQVAQSLFDTLLQVAR